MTPFAGVFAILAHCLVDGAAFGAHRLNMAFDILFRFRIDNRTDIGGQALPDCPSGTRSWRRAAWLSVIGDPSCRQRTRRAEQRWPAPSNAGSQHVDHYLAR
ncbi:hypothetical protein MJ585_10645 [Klebsiella pneumoniae]|nr:hypothetical protein MJ585_10645 [Klebsiella pneumoniae]